MGSNAPPSGWEVVSGTWGTDIDRETSTTLTGPSGIKFPSTGSGGTIMSPWIKVGGDSGGDGPSDLVYGFYVRFRASSVAAGSNITIKVYTYDENRTQRETYTAMSAVVASAANEWIVASQLANVGSYNARWARFEITKANSAFDLYIDSAVAKKLPPHNIALSQSANQTITQNTWTYVNATTKNPVTTSETADAGASPSSGGVALSLPGIYIMRGLVEFDDLADGETIWARFRWTNPGGFVITSRYVNAHASTSKRLAINIVTMARLEPNNGANNEVHLQVFCDGVDRTLSEVEMSIVRVGD